MRHFLAFLHIRSAWAATVWYVVLTGAVTWPLAAGLGRDLPRDLGDPLLNTWILAWGAHRLWDVVTGHPGALDGFWSANIFYPEPLALAYSEALIPQVLQILPVYGLTKNAILCYNLIFLSTFVLSGLGVYLLVRELTRDAPAGFVGGLLYAFALYRVCQFPHVQVLSSQWMPFVLYGFRRYFEWGRARALVGAGAALWAQNLSCGYYLFFFAPFVALYLAWELLDRGRWRERHTLTAIGITLAATLAATVPFLVPYLSVRIARPLSEIIFYSADVYSYLSTTEFIKLWGSIVQIFPKPEGELFPGVVPLALALAAVAIWAWEAWRHAGEVTRGGLPEPWWRRGLARLAALVVLAYGAALVVLLLHGRTVFSMAGVRLSIKGVTRPLQVSLVALGALLAASPRARAFVRGVPGSSVGFFLVALVAAFLFSLGPRMKTLGQTIGSGPYAWLLAIEPGINSVRVPARFAMLVALALAVLGGLGAAALRRRVRRTGSIAVVAASILFLVEGCSAPIAINVRGYAEGLRLPEYGPIRQGDQAPPVYREVAALPEGSVLVELPFGAFTYEFRYMFYSTQHWKPLLNGYSGYFPLSYDQRRAVLARVSRDPSRAWSALAASGATHAIVHEAFYADEEGTFTNRWLEQHGARLLGTFEYDRLYELPPSRD